MPDSALSASDGKIITFYSYKGGVGRTFALANVATQLAQWGYRVICIDWDLEAPGFDCFFPRAYHTGFAGGLPDLINRLNREHIDCDLTNEVLSGIVVPFKPTSTDSLQLDLIFAGSPSLNGYGPKLASIDWKSLYANKLGDKLERLRQHFKERYDFILIDSRTGLTDTSGICTMHLPDLLVAVYSTNSQSLGGTAYVGQQAINGKRHYYYTEGKLRVMPLLSRFDQREHPGLASEWLQRIVSNERMMSFYDDWTPPGMSLLNLISATKIPYTTRWSFGEELPVLLEQTSYDGPVCPNGDLVTYWIQNISALLCHDLGSPERLLRERETYVASAGNAAVEPVPEDHESSNTVWQRLARRGNIPRERQKEVSISWLLIEKLELLLKENRLADAGPVLVELNHERSMLGMPPVELPAGLSGSGVSSEARAREFVIQLKRGFASW